MENLIYAVLDANGYPEMFYKVGLMKPISNAPVRFTDPFRNPTKKIPIRKHRLSEKNQTRIRSSRLTRLKSLLNNLMKCSIISAFGNWSKEKL